VAQRELLRDGVPPLPDVEELAKVSRRPAFSTGPVFAFYWPQGERAAVVRRMTIACTALGAPMLFQRFPHRPPVLCGRLHDDFLDVLLDQPVG